MSWQSFWDRFHSSIHKNTHLNDIEKFSYLQYFLCSSESAYLQYFLCCSANESISGIAMTEEYHTEAINLLHELYGNTQVQISVPVKQFSVSLLSKVLYEHCFWFTKFNWKVGKYYSKFERFKSWPNFIWYTSGATNKWETANWNEAYNCTKFW